jgi:hypothetical protein
MPRSGQRGHLAGRMEDSNPAALWHRVKGDLKIDLLQ